MIEVMSCSSAHLAKLMSAELWGRQLVQRLVFLRALQLLESTFWFTPN